MHNLAYDYEFDFLTMPPIRRAGDIVRAIYFAPELVQIRFLSYKLVLQCHFRLRNRSLK